MDTIRLLQIPLSKLKYQLTVIEDQQTPLAQTPVVNQIMFVGVIIILVLIIAISIGVVYYVMLNRYRTRITDLCEKNGLRKQKHRGWKISALKDTVKELEARLVNGIPGDERKN